MAENEQGTVTIDGKTYRLDQLSDTAKAQLANIRYVDREIEQARNHLAVLQAARQYYAQVLTRELPKEGEA
ncbi:MAG: hypothetical protein KatS3mg124_0467 [Porticoccaceae bacterium]|nr:MAG: hypothetical protein KatS3mg124_0467 [Porticoccaceae bacterium]